MKKNRIQQEFDMILKKLSRFTYSLSLGDIEKSIEKSIHKKTIQRRLKSLVKDGLVEIEGKGRNQKYFVNKDSNAMPATIVEDKNNL